MPSLSDRLRNRDDQLLSVLMRSSDAEVLKQFGQEWVAQPDVWPKLRLSEYLTTGRFPRAHAGLLRGILQTAVEHECREVMASLFVGIDRSVRRRRIMRQVFEPSGQESRETLQVSRQRAQPAISVAMRGWLRRQVHAWFENLRQQDSYEYLRTTCLALSQYRDEDFGTAERILDNFCLLRTCFARSSVLAFGPVHATVVDGYSLNDLEPSPKSPAEWQRPDAAGHLVTLAARSPAAFIRWWATEQFAKASRGPIRIDIETVVQLVACSDENLMPMIEIVLQQQAAEFAPTVWQQLLAASAATHLHAILNSLETLHEQGCLSAAFLATLCTHFPDQGSPMTIATLARLLRTSHDPFQSSSSCVPFLKLMLETAGCSRLRPWLLEQLLCAKTDDAAAADAVRQFLSDQLVHLSSTARLDYLAAMHRSEAESVESSMS